MSWLERTPSHLWAMQATRHSVTTSIAFLFALLVQCRKHQKAWYKYALCVYIQQKTLQKGKKEEPDVQSRFKERNSKKEQKGSYREMLDNVFELRRRIYMFWRVIIVLLFAVLVKTTTICIFHGHILILYNFFLKRQWFLLKGIKCFSYVHVML